MTKWARKTGCIGRQDEKVPMDGTVPNWPHFFKKERAFRLWRSDAGPNATWANFIAKRGPWQRLRRGTWRMEHTTFACIDAALALLRKDHVYRRWDGDGIEKTWRSFLQNKWKRVLCAARQPPAPVTPHPAYARAFFSSNAVHLHAYASAGLGIGSGAAPSERSSRAGCRARRPPSTRRAPSP